MSTWGERQFGHFLALDRALVAAGFPATSQFFLDFAHDFLTSGCRQAVLRVGRRGGKSSTMCRLAVVSQLWGEHKVPPGDTGLAIFVSVSREEAGSRIKTIEAILRALRIGFHPIESGIELDATPFAFKSVACTIAGTSGGTGTFCSADEVAKARNADGVNPMREVIASLRPTMATQPNARMYLVSSPMGPLDAHFDAFEAGNSEFQRVYHAPTWVANPTITEAETHALEPDPSLWSREYAAIPASEVDEAMFNSAELKAITTSATELPFEPDADCCAAIDPAFRGDIFALVVGMRSRGSKLVRIAAVREWQGSKANPLAPETTLKAVAAVLKAYGISSVFSDQHSADALVEIGTRVGLRIITEATTQASKLEDFESLRVQVRAGELELVDVSSLRSDLLNVRRRITRNGVTIELPRVGGRHSDTAVAVARVAKGLRGGNGGPLIVPTYRDDYGSRWGGMPSRGF